MKYQFLQPWHQFLPRGGGYIVTLFGGGGKTSLLAHLAAFYHGAGIPVVATTTTRTEPLAWFGLEVRELEDLRDGAVSLPPQLFVRNGIHGDGKWRGLRPEDVDRLAGLSGEPIVLVEADGSGGKPVKVHRENEPVWPGHTSLALAVLGLSAIGRPVGEILHRYRRLPARWLPAAAQDDLWTWEHMFQLLAGEGGYLARIPPGVPTVLVLSQLGSLEDSIGLFEFTNRVMSRTRIPLVVFCELQGPEPRIQTVCTTDVKTAGQVE